jgi:nucleotide-binding universal stress UspA family protein
MGLSTIVAACDFSTNATLAIERAQSIAQHHGARLVLAHAFAPISSSRVDLSLLPPEFEVDSMNATLQRLEEEAVALADGIAVQPKIERGAPAATIVEIARDEKAELIVAGSRGLSGFEHAMLGSTAESIVGQAPCPVLVVHENDVATLDPPSCVLLPTNLTSDVEVVAVSLEHLFGSRNQTGGSLRLILAHADRIPPLLQPALHALTSVDLLPFDQVEVELRHRLEPVAAELRERGFDASVEVQEGEAAGSMIEIAGRLDVDLIAMATHGRSGLSKLLLGSTARRVVQHAPCPVLTVPLPERI